MAIAGTNRTAESANQRTPSSLTWLLIPFSVTPPIALPQTEQNLCPSLSCVPQLSQNIRLPSSTLYELHYKLFCLTAGATIVFVK